MESERKKSRNNSAYLQKIIGATTSTDSKAKKAKLRKVAKCLVQPTSNTVPRTLSEPAISQPVGFLFSLDERESGKLQKAQNTARISNINHLIAQFNALHTMFPSFPKSMLHFLFIVEQGNSKAVVNSLIHRGWVKERSVPLKLSRKADPNFTTLYYFGLWEKSYKKILRNEPTGSYLTAVILENNNFSHRLFFVKSFGVIEQRNLPGPVVTPALATFLRLSSPIMRPPNLKPKCVPFLEC